MAAVATEAAVDDVAPPVGRADRVAGTAGPHLVPAGPADEHVGIARTVEPIVATTAGIVFAALLGPMRSECDHLPDGRALVAGGAADRSTELWDPATGASVPAGRTALRGGNAELLPDGRVLVTDGTSAEVWALAD